MDIIQKYTKKAFQQYQDYTLCTEVKELKIGMVSIPPI